MGESVYSIFATIGALLVFGTLWFWVVSALIFGWLIFLTEAEDPHVFGAGIVLFAFIWIMSSANDVSVFVNPLVWLKWAVIYMVVGAVWSFIKWFSFLFKQKDKLKSLKAAYVTKNEIDLVNEKFQEADWPRFAAYLRDHHYGPNIGYEIKKPKDVIPTVQGRVGDLTCWIVWWPMSAFWTILNDPLRRIARAMINALRGQYTRMANAVFSSEV